MSRPVGYVLKMYPRLSETFILNELLELERQGQPIHVFSLRPSDDRRSHADVARVRAPVMLVPRDTWPVSPAVARAHLAVLRRHPVRYLRRLRRAVRRRGRSLEAFNQAVVIAAEADRLGVGHIHAHFASGATSAALEVHRLSGTSFSFTAHAKDIFSHDVRTDELATKLRAARFTVTVSDFNVVHLSRIESSARIVRVYNGLDLERFTSVRPRTGTHVPVLLAVGRLVEKKGFADLVDACAQLRDRGCAFRCVIVGTGSLETALRRQVAALGLSRVVALAGALTREQVVEWYARASVLVAPCIVGRDGNRDGLPTVLTEAMAFGLPVIATDVTGIPELVRDGETGLIVPQRDPARLADAIEVVLGDPPAAARRAALGRARVEREFDLRANVAELRRRFEEAAA